MSAPANLAERQAQALLGVTSNEALLQTFAALTHRIDAAERVESGGVVSELRLQRDMVRAECLRRMGERIEP